MDLAAALHLARAHQRRQRRIEALVAEIGGLDDALRSVCAALGEGKRELDDILDEADERLAAIDKAKEAAIPYPELLTYAQRLSPFTSAPPGVSLPDGTGPPPPSFFPPFPNEEKMRRGRLNAEEPLGMLGETGPVGKPPSPNTVKAQQQQQQQQQHQQHHPAPLRNGFGHDHRPQVQGFDFDLDLNPDL
ncbi:hypothetical protein AURDEDRAFT_113104 [Auricularia subglabra TFB-10046 SS5]|nr:hypothetical protein AURDEDRAFT_113104 [Auricularia subglabra TFB-10046 SS5]